MSKIFYGSSSTPGCPTKGIAAALSISKGVVTKYVGLAAAAGLHWPAVQACDEVTLERLLLVAPERPPGGLAGGDLRSPASWSA